MKTQKELNALKEEVETLNKKLAELTDEELKEVTGGTEPSKEYDEQMMPNEKDPKAPQRSENCSNFLNFCDTMK